MLLLAGISVALVAGDMERHVNSRRHVPRATRGLACQPARTEKGEQTPVGSTLYEAPETGRGLVARGWLPAGAVARHPAATTIRVLTSVGATGETERGRAAVGLTADALLRKCVSGESRRPTGVPLAHPTGVCFDIQRYSIHDGPGIRTTVFLKGCPLACPWCHNPEGIEQLPEVRVFEGRCVRCRACSAACPRGLADGPNIPDPALCLRCGSCAAVCPTGARQLVGHLWTATEIFQAIERDRLFYDESGGGVTFSGGEPLLQWRFLLDCLAVARARGLRTAVDTSGYASRRIILRVAALTDLFLYDLKVLDPERHLRFTGVPLAPILRNLRALDEAGAQIWLRMPLVPGYNDDRANLEAVASFVADLRHTRRLHVLPYHRLGAEKYARLGRADPMGDTSSPSPAAVEAAATVLRTLGLDVRVGG